MEGDLYETGRPTFVVRWSSPFILCFQQARTLADCHAFFGVLANVATRKS